MGVNVNRVKLVAFDLDGTILPSGGFLGDRDIKTLKSLGEMGVFRVMATGRSLFSLQKVIASDFPVDYVIFSSGAGILDWKKRKIFERSSLNSIEIRHLFDLFRNKGLDFMVHMPVPDNHNFHYYAAGGRENLDFERRKGIYSSYGSRIHCQSALPPEAAQFLAVIPPEEVDHFITVRDECEGFSVIRATSPLDGRSIWMEVFPREVSKGRKLEVLCRMLNVNREDTAGIGNDYNDMDMLEWVENAYAVGNSPNELRDKFHITDSVENSGFTQAIEGLMNMQEDSC